MTEPAINADDRPLDFTPISTADLPLTPIRDRNIPVEAWIEAPSQLIELHRVLPPSEIPRQTLYKRRIGPWLLWRTGPAAKADACYWVAHIDYLERQFTFLLTPDGAGVGVGPSGEQHDRFRGWKIDLKEHPDL